MQLSRFVVLRTIGAHECRGLPNFHFSLAPPGTQTRSRSFSTRSAEALMTTFRWCSTGVESCHSFSLHFSFDSMVLIFWYSDVPIGDHMSIGIVDTCKIK